MAIKITGTTVVDDSRNLVNVVSVSASTISDVYGNIRDIPFISAQKTTAYTLQVSDIGQLVVVATGGSVVIPNSVFSAGNAVSIVNNTAVAITITCTIGTAYISGVATDRATVSLKPAGLATIVFLSPAYCIISGAVI